MQNEEIRNNDTFLVMLKDNKIPMHFYQMNGNSWAVTGEETRFFMPGTETLDLFLNLDDNAWYLNSYSMRDYTGFQDRDIDGIIFIEFDEIRLSTLIKQKINELFHKEAFDAWIDETKDILYVPLSHEESDYLIELYEDQALSDIVVYDMYYDTYFDKESESEPDIDFVMDFAMG